MLKGLLAGAALLLTVQGAQATLMTTASLTAAASSTGTTTALKLAGISTPSETTITTSAYTASFANLASGQGVVNGSLGGAYAVPVAGQINGAAAYLTGDYGSSLTTNMAAAGNYLSTGTGSILVTFAQAQKSLSLLWGSIDTFNSIDFLNSAGTVIDTLTGATIQAMIASGAGDGYQGYGGSAYVTATESSGFNEVRFSSSTPSFEFSAVAASTGTFNVPEPATLSLFGSALVLAGLMSRSKRARRALRTEASA